MMAAGGSSAERECQVKPVLEDEHTDTRRESTISTERKSAARMVMSGLAGGRTRWLGSVGRRSVAAEEEDA